MQTLQSVSASTNVVVSSCAGYPLFEKSDFEEEISLKKEQLLELE